MRTPRLMRSKVATVCGSGGLAGVVEETAGDEASVAFEDNVLAIFLDDCPRLGGIKTVFGDTFRQGNDLWPEFPQ